MADQSDIAGALHDIYQNHGGFAGSDLGAKGALLDDIYKNNPGMVNDRSFRVSADNPEKAGQEGQQMQATLKTITDRIADVKDLPAYVPDKLKGDASLPDEKNLNPMYQEFAIAQRDLKIAETYRENGDSRAADYLSAAQHHFQKMSDNVPGEVAAQVETQKAARQAAVDNEIDRLAGNAPPVQQPAPSDPSIQNAPQQSASQGQAPAAAALSPPPDNALFSIVQGQPVPIFVDAIPPGPVFCRDRGGFRIVQFDASIEIGSINGALVIGNGIEQHENYRPIGNPAHHLSDLKAAHGAELHEIATQEKANIAHQKATLAKEVIHTGTDHAHATTPAPAAHTTTKTTPEHATVTQKQVPAVAKVHDTHTQKITPDQHKAEHAAPAAQKPVVHTHVASVAAKTNPDQHTAAAPSAEEVWKSQARVAAMSVAKHTAKTMTDMNKAPHEAQAAVVAKTAEHAVHQSAGKGGRH